MAWLTGWDNRIEIDIDYTNDIGASVTWFPITIFLKNANGDSTKVFEEVTTNSRKIAITQSDGTTELKGEIELWTYDGGTVANSVAVIHTSLDGWVINANTSIYLYYDNDHAVNANIGDDPDDASSNAVWDSSFSAVYHLGESAGNYLDSTDKSNDAAVAGNLPDQRTGKIGNAQHLDGTGDKASRADDATLDMGSGNLTLELWLNSAELAGNRFALGKSNAGFTLLYWLYMASDGDIVYSLDGSVGGSAARITTNATYDDSAWHYITGVRLGDTSELRVDYDTEVISGAAVVGNIDNDGAFLIGDLTASYGSEWNGFLDEIRISKGIARSDAWIKGTYNGGIDGLLTIGSEEVASLAYTMVVTVGTFVLTGIASLFTKALNIATAVGTFTLTGIATALTKALQFVVTVGAFTLTGISAILIRGYTIAAAVGTFVLTGVSTTLTKALNVALTVGTFTLTGISAILTRGYTVIATVGAFTLTGISATFTKTLSMAAAVGSFILTGITVTIQKLQFQRYIIKPLVRISGQKIHVDINQTSPHVKIKSTKPTLKL